MKYRQVNRNLHSIQIRVSDIWELETQIILEQYLWRSFFLIAIFVISIEIFCAHRKKKRRKEFKMKSGNYLLECLHVLNPLCCQNKTHNTHILTNESFTLIWQRKMPSKSSFFILFLKSKFKTFCNGNKVKIKITNPWMLIDSSAVKRISCFFRGLGFSYQHSYGGSQISPVQDNLIFSSGISRCEACKWFVDIPIQAEHT